MIYINFNYLDVCVFGQFPLVLLSRPHRTVSQLLQCCHMDCAEKRRSCESVWSQFRSWIISSYVRLGADFVYWLAVDDSILGGRKRCDGVGCRDVDRGPDYV